LTYTYLCTYAYLCTNSYLQMFADSMLIVFGNLLTQNMNLEVNRNRDIIQFNCFATELRDFLLYLQFGVSGVSFSRLPAF